MSRRVVISPESHDIDHGSSDTPLSWSRSCHSDTLDKVVLGTADRYLGFIALVMGAGLFISPFVSSARHRKL
jgi:hypothetical protein